ncbi:hypothetical protein JCM3766R1_006184 [Sporobolomyces carnicolor]
MAPIERASNSLGNIFGGGLTAIFQDLEIARRYGIAWYSIACFDTLSLLSVEREYIWTSKWTVAKVLFLVKHVLEPLRRWGVLSLLTLMQILEAVPISRGACLQLYWIGTATGIFTSFLVALAAAHLTLTISAASHLHSINMPPFVAQALKLEGCGTLGHAQLKMSRYLTIWGTFFFVDAVVLGLTLYKSVQVSRRVGNVPIVRALWRDGLVYYLVITLVHLVSVVLILQQARPRLKALNNPASLALMSLMASRLVLSLRSRTSRTSVSPAQGSPGRARVSVRVNTASAKSQEIELGTRSESSGPTLDGSESEATNTGAAMPKLAEDVS